MENTAEDDLTPESAEIMTNNAGSRLNKRDRKESFTTHDFASIDSFVKLENTLGVRGQSFVAEACQDFEV